MLNFFAGIFAIAGLLAATGPIIIHLLNRRRYRTVSWAAMDFLKEAMQRNRKILHLRDLVLLLLRVACVLLFGLALARPYFSNMRDASLFQYVWLSLAAMIAFGTAVWAVLATTRATRFAAGTTCLLTVLLAGNSLYGMMRDRAAGADGVLSSRQPLHAVLVVDNSLSMGYESLQGTLLDQAKSKAADFIDQLPAESRVSVIPLCGSEAAFSLDAYRNKDDARDALSRIEVVDRRGTAVQAIDLAEQACNQVPELPAKRVVFLSDQQAQSWPAGSLKAKLDQLPELQVVQVAADSAENVWVSDFRVQDGIADVETPTVFLATVSYQGSAPLINVQATLSIDNVPVHSQTAELEPGQSRQLEFQYQVDSTAEPGRPNFVTASVSVDTDSVGSDRLKSDNERYLSVPVVAGIPVVFVDQYGEEEDPNKGFFGETYRLRRLLAPRLSREESRRQLIRIRHTSIDKLDREILEDARLVVIAGVASPQNSVSLLRQYVLQGGQLVIAAGANFDPVAWTELGWLDGAGILPAPLKPQPFGDTPEEAIGKQELNPFFLSFESMQHDYFQIEQESREVLEDLYRLPLFFKAVEADLSDERIEEFVAAETERIAAERTLLTEAQQRRQMWMEMERQGTFGDTEAALQAQDEDRLRDINPQWLLWKRERLMDDRDRPAEEVALRARPRVLASFADNRLPFLIERQIGDGQVLLATSGTFSTWNTLTSTNAILMFDRIFRSMLEQTMPRRNFGTDMRIALPLEQSEQLRYTLSRPNGTEDILTVEALGAELYGVNVRHPFQSGHYVLTAHRVDPNELLTVGEKVREVPLAVNGPMEESDLRTLNAETLQERLGAEANFRWIGANEPISLEGAQVRGRDLWKLLIRIVLVCLLIEMLILAWPTLSTMLHREQAA